MKYHSTRGEVKGLSFEQMLLSGYAKDGGMLLAESFPQVPAATLKGWAGLTFQELAYEVVSLYITDDAIPAADLKDILTSAFSTINAPEIVPIVNLADGLKIAELFHGPSLAFKDLAMSCMSRFFNYYLQKSNRHMTLIVCTSGDTGSSAIEAVRGLPFIDIIVLLPRGRCTNIQEKQMTTVLDSNVHVYRVDGSSDDIDLLVRDLFADEEFVKRHFLASPSSLNFARILVQLVHFFYVYLKLCPSGTEEVELVLPTGGAGNITAGSIAQKMGLPVKFVCAVNHNNILSRMMDSGQCKIGEVDVTLAPAMDIQFAYNLERVWFLCCDEDSEVIVKIMSQVDKNLVEVPMSIVNKMKSIMKIYTVESDEEIKATIQRCWKENEYNICPHTAVGVSYHYSTLKQSTQDGKQSAVLATASPLKFPEAIEMSGVPAPSSEKIEAILAKETRFTDMEKGQDWTEMIKAKIVDITKGVENGK